MVDEEISQTNEEPEDGTNTSEEEKVHSEVFYKCLRCGTNASNTDLDKLPEIKCICGFRVFTKVRPQMPKTVDAI
ncbi:MAG: DNA-directed RNA polymerase subunit P (rpoP) [Cenarchaeum symbiont of Oopsacas minuta]|nr:DNA-directed RNA polymerase subunit P (rpoP) [Cenarchaeum symbiont of Oopsacas minuta]